MRVNLPPAEPGAAGDPGTTPLLLLDPTAPVAMRVVVPIPVSRVDRICRRLASWTVAVPCLLACAAVLGWSLVVRFPNQGRLLAVNARSLKPVELPAPPVAAAELARVRARASLLSGLLVPTADSIPVRLGELEQRARSLGWRMELLPQPVVEKPGGLTDLAIHPVRVELRESTTSNSSSASGFSRLLSLLREISASSNRMEVTSLRVHSSGAALGSAEAEVMILRRSNPHEANPPK